LISAAFGAEMRFPFQWTATTAAESHDFSFSLNKIHLDTAPVQPVAAAACNLLQIRTSRTCDILIGFEQP
jgi:hypothetical protein